MQNTIGDVGTFTVEGETLTGTVVWVGNVINHGLIIIVRTKDGDDWMLRNDGTLFTKTGESSAAGGRRRRKTRSTRGLGSQSTRDLGSRSTRDLGSRRRSLRRRGA
jgi:hypothetical protein